jgi:hypothetical protein
LEQVVRLGGCDEATEWNRPGRASLIHHAIGGHG